MPLRLLARSLVISVTAVSSVDAQQPVLAAPELRQRIDSFVSARIAADAFSGVVVHARNGEILYERAAGLADRERAAPMRIDTKLQIASATKLYTHIAILQLEQSGRLALTDTVGKFLPAYANAVVRSRVTIEQLLRHRSGVGSFWNAEFRARRDEIRSVNDYIALFQNDSLLFEPGTREMYSNGGYVILGAIIEQVTGMTYHDYVRERILWPAGMRSTLPRDTRVSYDTAAIGYTRQPGGAAARRPNTAFAAGLSGPAGDHYSTVGDFLRLAAAIASRQLLDSARTTALLGARYARGTDFRANGGGPGVNAEFSIFPTGDVVVVLSNYDPPAATEVAAFIRALIQPR
jgi:D-alanyl-D-alanine carboxypeptidase